MHMSRTESRLPYVKLYGEALLMILIEPPFANSAPLENLPSFNLGLYININSEANNGVSEFLVLEYNYGMSIVLKFQLPSLKSITY